MFPSAICIEQAKAESTPVAYAAVFDGHGGYAAADWLSINFSAYVDKFWNNGAAPIAAITEAFLKADKRVCAPKKGFLGSMGERGIGGSKCGATGAVALLYKVSKNIIEALDTFSVVGIPFLA